MGKLVAHLRRGCRATRVPFMAPSLPTEYVRRGREIDSLVDLLFAGEKRDGIVIGLRGPGGFGKTTLAAALCHHDRTLDAFDDGVLWVRLGKSPNLLSELVKLYAALTGERPAFVDVDDASRELALKLENKNCLIVIDDAWDTGHVRPFLQGRDGCARLITTRLFEVVSDIPRVDVDQMTRDEAVQLLLGRAGVTPTELDPFRTVVRRLGDWPLAVKLAGSTMRQRIGRGNTPARALDYVGRALEKRGITAFDKDHGSDPADAVARTVEASFELLDPDNQRRCTELAIFPESAVIPLATVSAVWRLHDFDTEDLARKLDDLALIEFDLGRGVLRLHSVLREFLAERLTNSSDVHAQLLDCWGNPYALPDAYAWRTFAYHMSRAGRAAALRELLLDVRWLEAKLRASDIHSLIADFEGTGRDPVIELVGDALRLSASALAADATQIRGQLLGRLRAVSDPEIAAFRELAYRTAAEPWLELMHQTLDTPGNMLMMTLVGHTRGVTALAADREQRWLLSGSSDTIVGVWHLPSGQWLRALAPHALGVRALAMTLDGELAVVGAADGLIYLWDIWRGHLRGHLSRRAGHAITGVAVSGDGRVIVSAARERLLRVWDAATRGLVNVLEGHNEAVTAVDVSTAGTRAVSGSDDSTVRIWNIERGVLERTLEGHGGAVTAVAISGDGRFILSGSVDRSVRLWDAEGGACLRTLEAHAAPITAVRLAARGRWAISGSSDQHAKLWDLDTGEVRAELEGHTDAVTAVTINETGTRAATASTDRTIKVWRLNGPQPPLAIEAHHGAVESIVFSGDGRLCASGGEDGTIKVWDVESGRVVRTIDAQDANIRSLAFSPDSSCVLSAGGYLTCRQWTIESGEGTWIPVRHIAPVDCYALSAEAHYLITACSDRTVNVWDVPSGALVDRYGTRRLFDHLIRPAPERRELPDTDENRDRYLPGEPLYHVVRVQTTPDGGHVIFSAMRVDPTTACLVVLNLVTGQIQSFDLAQAQPVEAFALNPQTMQLVWAHADHRLELWDLRTEQPVRTLVGHTDAVNAILTDESGPRVLSCGRDRTVRMWHVETGKQLTAFTADAAIRCLAITADGETIAAGDVAGRVHLLRLNLIHQ